MTVSAVVFDWGGTLSVWANADMIDMWRLAARHLAPHAEEEVCAQLVAVEQAFFDRISVDQRSTTLAELLAAASTELGLDVAEAVLEEAALHHLDSWTPHIVHDPDAQPVLAALKARGIKTGLLSNTHWPRAFHEHFLERDGLAEHLDVRTYSSELTHTKPHPIAFRSVLRELGVLPAETVFVGDRLYDDVFGAKANGLTAVWRRSTSVPGFEVEPDATIDRLPELLTLVDEWTDSR